MQVYDPLNFDDYIKNLEKIGFQSTETGKAALLLEKMLNDKETLTFFSFTANLVASGLRGFIAKLAKEKKIDVIITTAGSIEHDVIKAFFDYEIGSFYENDVLLHKKGINRIGNIKVKNKAYILFEEICKKIFANYDDKKSFSPSELSKDFGLYIEKNAKKEKREKSFLYWCHKNDVPIFCPGVIDGALGLQIYFYMQKNKNIYIDYRSDMKKLADIVMNAKKTGAIILGGGISKHHLIGANLLRGGLDYAIYITTATDLDGSLSGAKTNEAVSWGKISEKGLHLTIFGEATIIFPLLLKKAKLI
jgi:deoxyhypusine synthase